jgi:hypothetical protein
MPCGTHSPRLRRVQVLHHRREELTTWEISTVMWSYGLFRHRVPESIVAPAEPGQAAAEAAAAAAAAAAGPSGADAGGSAEERSGGDASTSAPSRGGAAARTQHDSEPGGLADASSPFSDMLCHVALRRVHQMRPQALANIAKSLAQLYGMYPDGGEGGAAARPASPRVAAPPVAARAARGATADAGVRVARSGPQLVQQQAGVRGRSPSPSGDPAQPPLPDQQQEEQEQQQDQQQHRGGPQPHAEDEVPVRRGSLDASEGGPAPLRVRRYGPMERLVEAICSCAEDRLHEFRPDEMACLLYGVSLLGYADSQVRGVV